MASAIGPGWRAFFEEGCCAFGFVGGAAEAAEDFGFEGEGGVQVEVFALMDGLDAGGDGEGGHGEDGAGEGLALLRVEVILHQPGRAGVEVSARWTNRMSRRTSQWCQMPTAR